MQRSKSISMVKDFNYIMENFLKQLTPVIGTNYLNKFKALCRCNALAPIEKFIQEVIPYKEKILKEDESYFVNTNNFKNKIDGKKDYLNEVLRIKEIYHSMDKDSKQETWAILQGLVKLAENYTSFRMNY